MSNILSNIDGIITVATSLVGFLGTAISIFFAVKNWIALNKEKTSKEVWTMLMEVADAAMKEAEASSLRGSDKKTLAMDTIKASALEAGLEISSFIEPLSEYIDQTISFVNDFKAKKR